MFPMKVYRHYKDGELYRLICVAVQESDGTHMAVYQSLLTGAIYTRPLREFEGNVEDGRKRFTFMWGEK